ncbi:MAG: alpha/beta fold hydrolase [Patescibacteria group bacterium]
MEKLFFKNSKGDKLCGLLSVVGDDRDMIAILCHGHSSGKNNKTWQTLEPILLENNISVFRFDFYGNGESDGKFEESNLTETTDDILCAIDYVKRLNFKRIVLAGSSFGGLSSIMAASKSKDLYALVLKSPVSDYFEVDLKILGETGIKEWKEKGVRAYTFGDLNRGLILNYSFMEDYLKYDAYDAAEKIQVPTLIVHGNEDQIVPFSQSQKLLRHLKDGELIAVSGADHSYTDQKKFDEMIKYIADYIVKLK